MKKILLPLALMFLLFIVSCGEDEETPEIGLSGTVTYNGETYEIASGFVSDVEIDNGIAIRSFFLSDVELEANSGGVTVTSAFGIVITATFGATDESDLVADTYNTASDINGRRVEVRVQTADGTELAFTEGTIVLSGSAPTFTMVFDAPFRGTSLTGTVSGTYDSL